MKSFKYSLLLLSLALLLALAGCGEDNPVESLDPDITNDTDYFYFRLTNAYLLNETLTYTWVNTAEQATIEHLTARANGTAQIFVFDAQDTQVYQAELISGESEVSMMGVPGNWRIVVVADDFSGTLSFRVQAL